MKKIELLAPAGNFEKLEIAIHYGADAVYLAGKEFSLRNLAGNFTGQELENAIAYAHSHNVKVYVAVNIYARSHEFPDISEYILSLAAIKPDALIIADPGIIRTAKRLAPDIPLHLSTQSNTTNAESALFWKDAGISRVNTARELSLQEIRDMAKRTDMEIEAFVHGAMCISYSGRCLLSSYMAERDSNRGLCCHPCRWQYTLMEEKRPGHYYPVFEDERGTYIFNSKDLCMIRHIPELIGAGIHSLKIEGRMKGINYLAPVVQAYRHAIDTYYENPDTYRIREEWIQNIESVNHRGFGTGFYFLDADSRQSNFSNRKPEALPLFVGKVLISEPGKLTRVQARNKLTAGDDVEVMSPCEFAKPDRVIQIMTPDGRQKNHAQPNEIVDIEFNRVYPENAIIRKPEARMLDDTSRSSHCCCNPP